MSTATSNKEDFSKAYNLETTNKYETNDKSKDPSLLKKTFSKIFKKKEEEVEDKYIEPFMVFLKRVYKSNKYYKYKYLHLYYLQLLACIGIIIVFFGAITYNLIKINILKYKTQWPKVRCQPNFIPLAGVLNPIPGKTQQEIIQDNFNYCTTETLNGIVEAATAPGRSGIEALARIQAGLITTANLARNQVGKIKEKIYMAFKKIFEKLMEFLTPIRKLLIQGKVVLDKIMGVIVSIFYILQLIIQSITSAIRIIVGYMTAVIVIIIVTAILLLIVAILFQNYFAIGVALLILAVAAVVVGFIAPVEREFDGALRLYEEIKRNNA